MAFTRPSIPSCAGLGLLLAAGCVPDVTVISGGSGGASAAAGGSNAPSGGAGTSQDGGRSFGGAGAGRGGGAGESTGGEAGSSGEPGTGGEGAQDDGGGAGRSGDSGASGKGGSGGEAGSGCGAASPGTVQPPARHHLLVASYDSESGAPLTGDGCQGYSIGPRLLSGELACRKGLVNELGNCGATFCEARCEADACEVTTQYLAAICAQHEADPCLVLGGEGRSLRLDYDAPAGFSGYLEKLNGDCSSAPNAGPLNLDSLNLSHNGLLSFWIRYEGTEVPEVEVAIRSKGDCPPEMSPACDPQTAPKATLAEYATPCATWGDWIKICIPLTRLLRVDTGPRIEPAKLTEINFAFKSGVGSMLLDDLAFEQSNSL